MVLDIKPLPFGIPWLEFGYFYNIVLHFTAKYLALVIYNTEVQPTGGEWGSLP